MAQGVSAVASNGRLVDLDAATAATFSPHDFPLLESHAKRAQFAHSVARLVGRAASEGALAPEAAASTAALSDMALAVSSALAASMPETVDPRSGRLGGALARFAAQGTPTVVASTPEAGAAPGAAPLLVQTVLDPLSKTTQQLAQVRGGVVATALRVLALPTMEH